MLGVRRVLVVDDAARGALLHRRIAGDVAGVQRPPRVPHRELRVEVEARVLHRAVHGDPVLRGLPAPRACPGGRCSAARGLREPSPARPRTRPAAPGRWLQRARQTTRCGNGEESASRLATLDGPGGPRKVRWARRRKKATGTFSMAVDHPELTCFSAPPHEAHLPAAQHSPYPDAWLPRPHGDPRWSSGAPEPSPQGSQAARGHDLPEVDVSPDAAAFSGFGRERRLRKRPDFQRVQTTGARVHAAHYLFLVQARPAGVGAAPSASGDPPARLGPGGDQEARQCRGSQSRQARLPSLLSPASRPRSPRGSTWSSSHARAPERSGSPRRSSSGARLREISRRNREMSWRSRRRRPTFRRDEPRAVRLPDRARAFVPALHLAAARALVSLRAVVLALCRSLSKGPRRRPRQLAFADPPV